MTSCCKCDVRLFPPEPQIAAGLAQLPLQVLGFPEYRRAMLGAVRTKAALGDWRARDGDDLGLMVPEWWAYVLDIVAFYDQQITQGFYLRTATQPAAVRGLTALIGYRPRPALAAEALVAAIVERGPDVVLPAFSAFRSDAFGQEPPQVFETVDAHALSFRRNRWRLAPIAETDRGTGPLLFDIPTLRLVRDARVVVSWPGSTAAARVTSITPTRAIDGGMYAEVVLEPVPAIDAGTALSAIAVNMPTLVVGINPRAATPVSSTTVILDAVYPQILRDQQVLIVAGASTAVCTVTAVATVKVPAPSALINAVPDLPATQLTVSPSLGSAFTTAGAPVTVHCQFVGGGRLVRPANSSVSRDDLPATVALAGVSDPLPEPASGPLLIQDRDKTGLALAATISVAADGTGVMTPPPDTTPFPVPLVPPIDVYGNVFRIVRGETVAHEVLGSGAAAVAFPSFTLKKKPLTYLPSASAASGRRSTLEVRVSGVRWTEVETFFATAPGDEVYIVRQNEDQDSTITFWRLPSGVNNVVARYRFGAGAARPPANAITQLVRSVKGLRMVSPVAASSGADADRPADIKTNAPAVALTLGRAVSLTDFEALARAFGVVNVTAGWAWDPEQQRAVITLWFIANGGDPTTALRSFLRGQADPNVPIVVTAATPDPMSLVIDIEVDSQHDTDTVRAALVTAMSDPETGPLSHRNVSIGGSVFRSVLVARASAVPGVAAINGISVNGSPAPVALTAPEGHYLDFLPFTNE